MFAALSTSLIALARMIPFARVFSVVERSHRDRATLSVLHDVERVGPHPLGYHPRPIATCRASREMIGAFPTSSREISPAFWSVVEYGTNSPSAKIVGVNTEKRNVKIVESASFLCLPVYVFVFERNICLYLPSQTIISLFSCHEIYIA